MDRNSAPVTEDERHLYHIIDQLVRSHSFGDGFAKREVAIKQSVIAIRQYFAHQFTKALVDPWVHISELKNFFPNGAEWYENKGVWISDGLHAAFSPSFGYDCDGNPNFTGWDFHGFTPTHFTTAFPLPKK